MGFAEGKSLANQIFRGISSFQKSSDTGRFHTLPVEGCGDHHSPEHPKTSTDRIKAVEEGFLVFLKVFVVGIRKTFEKGEEGNEIPCSPGSFAPD